MLFALSATMNLPLNHLQETSTPAHLPAFSHVSEGITSPWGSPTLPRAQDPISAPQGHQLLPQQHCMWASLQLHTAQSCPGMGPLSQAHVLAWTQSAPIPREVPNIRGPMPPSCLLLAGAGTGPGCQALPSPTTGSPQHSRMMVLQ